MGMENSHMASYGHIMAIIFHIWRYMATHMEHYGTLWNIMEHYGRNMAYLFYVYGMKSMEKFYGTYGNIMETLWPYYGRNRIFHNFPYYGKNFHSIENLWRAICHMIPYHICFTSCDLRRN